MNKLFKSLSILTAILLFASGCRAQAAQAAQPPIDYQAVLGKPLNDNAVTDFIVSNNCAPGGPFQLCQDAGLAFWIDSNQIVNKVYLYAGNADGFRRYKGKLPFGLSFYDPMWKVEDKLRNLNADETSQPTWMDGLPDEGSSPDHFHYWADYKRFGMTVIYDSPFADEDAYIYAVVVNA